MNDERRSFQRLALTKPIDGWFGDFLVRLLDVSVSGALIEYTEDIPLNSRALLRFFWRGREIEIMAEIARNNDIRSGLHFLEQNPTLNALIEESAAELLRAQMANAAGERDANRYGDETLTAASAGLGGANTPYLVCTLGSKGWSRKPSLLPDQPVNGFTIAASYSPAQIDLLCSTYEEGNAEARRLTRLLAELSVARVRPPS